MVRTAVDREMLLKSGDGNAIICAHVHIYADTVRASQAIEHEVQGFLTSLYERLSREGRIIKHEFGRQKV